jgi:hypothetical protein
VKFVATRRNPTSAQLVVVKDSEGATVAQIAAGFYGATDLRRQEALIGWIVKACEQFEAVNPDEPFPKGTSDAG